MMFLIIVNYLMLLNYFISLADCFSVVNNNVCKSIPDYKYLRTSRKCFFNPDVLSTLENMVKRNNYPLEKHSVTTQDGYILTIYRITKNDIDRPPIIIQHGIAASGAIWTCRSQKSLAFYLYNLGYDVWITNIRGATDSTRHTKLDATTTAKTYWDFSFHEMGIYDLPAIIDHIALITKHKSKIIYLGHSMGTTMSYVYCSTMPQHCNEHLKGLIHLSPVAYMRNIAPTIKTAVALAPGIIAILENMGMYELGNQPEIRESFWNLCSNYPTIIPCFIVTFMGTGLNAEEVLPEIMPVIASYFPVGTSLKTIMHYVQIFFSGKFQQYDYGLEENLRKYDTKSPPEYNLSAISLPVYFFVGKQDALADEKDVDTLREKLVSVNESDKILLNYAHNDWFIGKHLEKFYDKLSDVLKRINSG